MKWTPARLVCTMLAGAIALSAGAIVALLLLAPDAPARPTVVYAARETERVTLANYQRVDNGMSYAEVSAILGHGTEISRTDLAGLTTIMYQWRAARGGANMNAMFQDDRLVSKAQFGLR